MTKRGFMSVLVVCVGAIVILMASAARAQASGGSTPILTVNGLDASMPVEVERDEDIIIAVTGLADEQKEGYSLVCEMGGELTALFEPDLSAEKPEQGNYLFTFADEESGMAIVSLMVGDILDYQLILFKVPDANIVIFGIDSDSVDYVTQPAVQQQDIAVPEIALPVSGGERMFYAMLDMDCNEVLDPNFYPNLNNDQLINFEDFAVLAGNWLESGPSLDGDLNGDEMVDVNDLRYFSYFWLANACGPSPEEVFESFKAALSGDDVNEAVSYFAEVSAENYRLLLEQLRPHFTQMVNDMGELIFIEQNDEIAYYDLLREENGDTYGYPVIFVRDEMGQWGICDF